MDNSIEPVFSAIIPKELKQGKLYISIECKIVVHKCCCGCGNKVHTPLTPRDWELIYNGKQVSLYPSIGGWHNQCQSHYIISMNRVIWAKKMSREKIEQGRAKRRAGAISLTAKTPIDGDRGFWVGEQIVEIGNDAISIFCLIILILGSGDLSTDMMNSISVRRLIYLNP